MNKRLIALLLTLASLYVNAKEVFIKGVLNNGIKVSSQYPLPANKCKISYKQLGTDEIKAASAYINNLTPELIGKCTVTESCQFITIYLEVYGYKRESVQRQITNVNGKYIVDIGDIKFTAMPAPRVETVVLSRQPSTGIINYQVHFTNPTNVTYVFTGMKVKIFIKHDFSSAGFTDVNTASLVYKINDQLSLQPAKSVKGGVEVSDNPDFLVPISGEIEFHEDKDLIVLNLKVGTLIKLLQQGDSYIQLQLPKALRISSNTQIVNDNMFLGGKFSVISLKLNTGNDAANGTIMRTMFEFQPANNQIPEIAYEVR